jgi:hypothetical protein
VLRHRLTAIALAVVVALAALAWAGHRYLTVQQTGEVSIPADDASPEEVVRAYVEAVDVRDCDTAEALNPDDRLCGNVESVEVNRYSSQLFEASSSPHRQRARVMFVADLEFRPYYDLLGGDATEVGQGWRGYILDREGGEGPWRIAADAYMG